MSSESSKASAVMAYIFINSDITCRNGFRIYQVKATSEEEAWGIFAQDQFGDSKKDRELTEGAFTLAGKLKIQESTGRESVKIITLSSVMLDQTPRSLVGPVHITTIKYCAGEE